MGKATIESVVSNPFQTNIPTDGIEKKNWP